MTQIVTRDAKLIKLRIGFDIQNGKGTFGYLICLQNVAKKILPWEEFFCRITSVVTDGESKNLGRFNGLVSKLKRLRNSAASNVSLFLIWCVAHRTNLTWRTVSCINIIPNVITSATKLSKYFHDSGKRTQDLINVAFENGLNPPLRYPPFFPVRWTEFVYACGAA